MDEHRSIAGFQEREFTLRRQPIFEAVRRRVVILIHGSNTLGVWQEHWEHRLKDNPDGVTVRRIAFKPTQLWRVVLDLYGTTRRTREIGRQIFDIIDELAADDQISIVAHSYGTALLVRWLRKNRGTKLKNIVLLGSIVRRKWFADLSARADNIYNIVATSDEVVCAAEAYGLGRYEATGAFGVRQYVRNVTDYLVEGDHATIVTVPFLDEVILPIVLGRPLPQKADIPRPLDQQHVWNLRRDLGRRVFSFLFRPAVSKTQVTRPVVRPPSTRPQPESRDGPS